MALRDIYRPRDVIEKDFSITVAAEVTWSAHTPEECTFYTHAHQKQHTLLHPQTPPSCMRSFTHTHTYAVRPPHLQRHAHLRSLCASLVSCRHLAGVKGQNEPPMRDAMRDLESPYTPPAHTPDLSVLQRNT